ncbi:MAG: DUF456 domain-containing protein [Bacteroidales bacterium]|nr:DUF456 domain-containing protein [Bacteroidales bacterium]
MGEIILNIGFGDYTLVILGVLLMVAGILGCILPVIPGPPLSYGGLILLHLSDFADYSATFLVVFALIAIAVTILDYFVPIWGTRRFGGTRYGSWGATIGVILGIFLFPPLGIIILPFVGAVVGESIKGSDFNASLRSGFGSFMGFLMGTGIKLIASLIMAYYFFTRIDYTAMF